MGLSFDEIRERAIETFSIEEYISQYYSANITLKKKGADYEACCPLHDEKTPSFKVSTRKNIFKCFGCGEGGDLIKFIGLYEKLEYAEIIRLLAKNLGVEIESRNPQKQSKKEDMFLLNSVVRTLYQEQLKKNKEILTHLRERKITDESIELFELGFADPIFSVEKYIRDQGLNIDYALELGLISKKDDGRIVNRFFNRIMFPIHNYDGSVVGFAGRVSPNQEHEAYAKYINSSESLIFSKLKHLYGRFQARNKLNKAEKIYLVEGYTDVIAIAQSNNDEVVPLGTMGTALTAFNAKKLIRLNKLIVNAGDNDKGGIAAIKKNLNELINHVPVSALLFPKGDDPASFLKNHSFQEFEDLPKLNVSQFYIKTTQTKNPDEKADLLKNIIQELTVIDDSVKRFLWLQEVGKELDIPSHIIVKAYTHHVQEKDNSEYFFSRKFIHKLAGRFVKYLLEINPKEAESYFRQVPLEMIPLNNSVFPNDLMDLYKKFYKKPTMLKQLSLFGVEHKTNLFSYGEDETMNGHKVNRLFFEYPSLNSGNDLDMPLEQVTKLLRAEVYLSKINQTASKFFQHLNNNDKSALNQQLSDLYDTL